MASGGAEGGSSQLSGNSTECLQQDKGEDGAVVEEKDAVKYEEGQEDKEPEPVLPDEGRIGEKEPEPVPRAESGEGQEHAPVKHGSTEQGMGRADSGKKREESDAHDWARSGMGQKQEGGLERGQGAGGAEENWVDGVAGAVEDDLGDHSRKINIVSGSTEPGGGPQRAEDGREGESRAGGSLGQGVERLAAKDRDVPAWATSGARSYSNCTHKCGWAKRAGF